MFALLPTTKYEVLQKEFEIQRNTYDPQNVFQFSQHNPNHVDSLFNIEEFFRLQGNFKEANALLERILFVYESCFSKGLERIFNDTKN